MSRHLVRLPASEASDPRQLIEICPGCAGRLTATQGILPTDVLLRPGDPARGLPDRSITIYRPLDPQLISLLREKHGVFHVVGSTPIGDSNG